MSTTPQNPYHDFLRKVAKMRHAQKDLKKYPNSRPMISAATRTEAEVDKWLENVGFQNAKAKQLQFDDAVQQGGDA